MGWLEGPRVIVEDKETGSKRKILVAEFNPERHELIRPGAEKPAAKKKAAKKASKKGR